MKHSYGGNIVIRISNYDTYAEISVQDDGDGIDEDVLHRILENGAKAGSGVGLINTDLRLKRHFGSGLQIKSTLGVGTMVSFKVPRK
ncbi:sensory histidine kinase AtoS [compost metagenome]